MGLKEGKLQVENIIRNSAVLLNDEQFLREYDLNELSAQSQTILDRFVECVNIINRQIATKYCPIKNKKVLKSNNGKILLSLITSEEVIEITQVLLNDDKIMFTIENGYLVTNTQGVLTFYYNIMPKTLTKSDVINYYYNRVNENIFAYGVVSEYLYIMGNIDEAKIWEEKFENAISSAGTIRKGVIMPQRRWY